MKVTSLQRICLIDKAINTLPLASKDKILAYLFHNMCKFSDSTLEKDLQTLRETYHAPLVFNKARNSYEYTESYNFSKYFIEEWSKYVDFPETIVSEKSYTANHIKMMFHSFIDKYDIDILFEINLEDFFKEYL
jgi:hypothetical protein